MIITYIFATQLLALGPMLSEADPEKTSTPLLSTRVFPAEVTNEDEYFSWLQNEDDKLARAAEKADPLSAADLLAYHANWLLSVRCEPYVTRLLLGWHTQADSKALEKISQNALARIGKAKTLWEGDEHEEQIELITDFGEAIVQFALARMEKTDHKAIGRAASGLAIWLDDDRSEIADAALLWQSLLFRENEKINRALVLLPLPLVPVNDSVVKFYARILRCTMLADLGRTTLALAMLLKMEERCSRWFVEEIQQSNALCTLTWLRIQLAKAAHMELGDASRKTMDSWIKRAQDSLQGEDETTCYLIRLHPVIPLFVEKPPLGDAWQIPTTQKTQTDSAADPSETSEEPLKKGLNTESVR